MRMHSYANDENPPRPNRISGYASNLAGDLGSGSYFQDPVTAGQWIHVAAVINTVDTSVYATGYLKIYKNGGLRDTTALSQYNVVPGKGNAPYRVGTRSLKSFFLGAIGKVAVYGHELLEGRLHHHYEAMCGGSCN